jgi:hypothetical protein
VSGALPAPGVWKNIRTRKSTAVFQHPFTLNRDVGELPAGRYNVEIDEEEIEAVDRTAYCRTAIYFYVQVAASTRMIVLTPSALESAIERDAEQASRD